MVIGGRKLRLNLGCCDKHLAGFVNVDRVPPADVIVDLCDEWPWPANSVEEIVAHDILEHLPSKIHTMNAAWRVLVPGGRFDIEVPTTDGRGAWQDPTHVSFWTANDLRYYRAGDPHRERFGVAYGVCARFRVISEHHRLVGPAADNVWKLHAILEAVK